MKKIGDVGGLKSLGFIDESLLDDDWDPEKHEVFDRLLISCFSFKGFLLMLAYTVMYVCLGDDASAI